MKATTIIARASGHGVWYESIEWGSKVAAVKSQFTRATHFVLPNLKTILPEDERWYYDTIEPQARIRTIASSRHNYQSLLQCLKSSPRVDKFLIVGGNAKGKPNTLSTVEATRILKVETDTELWGVANPNDETSPELVAEKIDAGIEGIITQPLLSTNASMTFDSYPRDSGVSYIAGLALPGTKIDLMHWLLLLDQPDLLYDDRFRHHMEYFEQGHSPLHWVQLELQHLHRLKTDGIHFMPLHNIGGLLSLLGNQ